ncbi:DUF2635 domain-containing protein [Bathymodiolus septemdierum thioautotrophic gill symbiont]|uniref:DUF2635 domain-containing protein n=1 Tax=endosymbiont of Bathymodiolus septemdierum str. Myojin knoll TaxID=1303921 RepID=A0A0P0US25_9GAMM|nr:DUF2635 domain-containing protein [Bathymodiolus septemdierum thioautotrophic gill symbiont]BAS67624.1 conserved hypothetical protein [endosymbiont of Bathymodiolus septemdierum str. Myojin knoll]
MPQTTFKLEPTKAETEALVLDPITKKPLKEGETKPKNTFWMARIAEGDVRIVKENIKNKEKK